MLSAWTTALTFLSYKRFFPLTLMYTIMLLVFFFFFYLSANLKNTTLHPPSLHDSQKYKYISNTHSKSFFKSVK